MKRKYYVFGLLAVLVISLYFIDREVWMKRRVKMHSLWEQVDGERNRGDFIDSYYIVAFKGDTMIFDYGKWKDTLVLKWEYFSSLKVLDPRTGKTTIYEMKGANWMDYCFGRYSRWGSEH